MNNPLVSIIIVNWNGERYIKNCLDAIVRHIQMAMEIIVVDNNSSDNSVSLIKKAYPWVRLIEPGSNLGFAKGNNLGAQYAKGRYLLLINNDAVLTSDITAAIHLLDSRSDIGAVGAKMLSTDGKYRYSAGHFPKPHRLFKISTMFWKYGYFKSGNFPKSPVDKFYPVDYVEGSFLLVKKSIWLEFGGLDSNFFMYGEDVEFCYRLNRAGFKTAFMPCVQYIHHGGFSDDREYLVTNGIVTFHKKWSGYLTQYLVLGILTVRLFLRYLIYRLRSFKGGAKEHKIKADASLFAMRELLDVSFNGRRVP